MYGKRVNMKKSFITIIISFFFLTGCSLGTPEVIVPKMSEVSPTSLSWEDIEHKGVKGHFLIQHEWQHVQTELINKGMKANMCIKIMNEYSK